MSELVSRRSSAMTSTAGSAQGIIAPGSSSPSTSTSTSPTLAAIPQRVVLPLSSSLLNLVPNHPILHTLSRPILPRIAHLESLVLKSPPSRVLQRVVGISPWMIILLANVGLVAALTRWREQWRIMLTLLGIAEGVTKTFKVLDRLDREGDKDDDLLTVDHDYNPDLVGLDTVARQELRQERLDSYRRELKHVLSFWLLFALLGTIESVRASASTVPLSTRLAPLTRSLKSLIRRLALRYPDSLSRIPEKFIPASLSSNPTVAQKRRPFPQPRRHVSKTSNALTTPSLPVVLFNSEPRYRIFKLLILWQGLRRDGFGASVLWDWFVGPIFGAYHRRRSAQALEKDPNGLPKIPRRRVINLVVSEEEEEAYLRGAAAGSSTSTTILDQAFEPARFSTSRKEGSRSTTSSSASSSTATSPSFYRRSGVGGGGGGHHFDDYETGEGDESYDSIASSSSSAEGSTAFPTPNVPFRLTSSSHPIQARAHSFPGSTSSSYLTHNHNGSPSPATRGFGGYDVSNGSALGAKWSD